MNILILIKTALRTLRQHKGRSFLTILSIIVGVSSIIATTAIGKGAAEKIRQKIMSIGDNHIIIYAGNWMQEGKTKATKKKPLEPLKLNDIKILEMQCSSIKKISPAVYRSKLITYQANTIMARICGGNHTIFSIIKRKISRGIFYSQIHVENAARVVVLGSKAAHELFGLRNPIGQTVTVSQTPCMVIGVLEEVKQHLGTHDPNLQVFMPYTTMKKRLIRYASPYIDGIVLSAQSRKEMPHLVSTIKKIIRNIHDLAMHDNDDFTIIDQDSMAKAAHHSSSILTTLLLIIASIGLLVGGIGVMNIMLVSVTERTQEIGLRMALGATSKVIRKQFLLEAITLCLIGGFFGILLGGIAPLVASLLTGWLIILQPSVIIHALLVTSCIGIFFGLYPAIKASRLDPVLALMDK